MSTPEQVEQLLANVPQEMRPYRRWLIWAFEPAPGRPRPSKVPRRPTFPSVRAESNNPAHYVSFSEAIELLRANPAIIDGIGFAPGERDPYVFADFDDEAEVEPEHLEQRRAMVGYPGLDGSLLHELDSYTEVSPSGRGLHVVMRGSFHTSGTKDSNLKIEFFASKGFVTITGNVVYGRREIKSQQSVIDRLGLRTRPASDQTLADDGELRRLDLSDEQVLTEVFKREAKLEPLYYHCVAPNDWSREFFHVVAALDRVCGAVAQVKRLTVSAPFVLMAPPKVTGGETRPAKAERLFSEVLSKARVDNNLRAIETQRGAAVVENLEANKHKSKGQQI